MPAGALALTDGTYKGRTSQGYKARLVVRDGRLKFANIQWLAHCRNRDVTWGPVTYSPWTDTPEGPIEQEGNDFSDSGGGRRVRPNERAYIIQHLSGHFSGDRVSGRMTSTVRFRAKGIKGRQYCRSRLRFNAKRVVR